MNYTETFQDFAAKVGPMDLALYAGVALVLWVLFQDKLGGVKDLLKNMLNKVKIPVSSVVNVAHDCNNDEKFFQLLTSWKRTRDLAVDLGCSEAVKVADQMFPYLSPSVCGNKDKGTTV